MEFATVRNVPIALDWLARILVERPVVDLNHQPCPYQDSVVRLYNNIQDRGDCQTPRKSYKTSHPVGWVGGWKMASIVLMGGQLPFAPDSNARHNQREVSSPFATVCQVRPRRQALGADWPDRGEWKSGRFTVPRFGRGFDSHRPLLTLFPS